MSAVICCRITFIFVFMIITGDCATIAAPNKSGILNEGLNITCTYTLQIGETFDSLTWARKRNSDAGFIDIAKFGSGEDPIYYESAGELRNRSNLLKITNGGYINIRTLICVDEAQFRCTVEYSSNGSLREQQSAMTVTLQGRPEKPSSLIQLEGGYAEYDVMTFVCTSLGSIRWEGIRGSNTQDLSADSQVINEAVTPGSCTRTFTSRLTRNVTRKDNGLVIRCRTIHTVYQAPEDYLDLPPLVINFPVNVDRLSIHQEPNIPVHDVGALVRLMCQITVVPAATYKWQHLSTNQVYNTGTTGVMILKNVQEDQNGTYECEATNSYLNVTFTAKKTIIVNIQNHKRTTLIMKPVSTSSGKATATVRTPNTPKQVNEQRLIVGLGIGVCVAFVIGFVIGAVLVFVVKKRRKKNIYNGLATATRSTNEQVYDTINLNSSTETSSHRDVNSAYVNTPPARS